ncbi:LCP family glycopolymer transferase [Microbacterium sp.]|uniref:LCP family glycopolymer transferase n=1 Tax=Microbacterium sp. TaxID=51671 RepID=UPI002810F398|nr:LCP family protein [Microbacterium sp.]
MKRPVAQHAPNRNASASRSLLRMLGIGAAVLTVAALGVGAFLVADLTARVGKDAVPLDGAPSVAPPAIGEYPGAFAILLVGTDECGPVSTKLLGERCESEDGIRNDVNLLVHVSDEPRKVTVVSFPRDLMTEVPACVTEDGSTASPSDKKQINTVFRHAGLSCVARTVTELSGVEIGFAAKLSFDGVMEITDAVGGVEVCIGEDGLHDRETGLDWEPGLRTVEGYEALQFLRTRKSVGDGSDLARISNQQQYMSRLARKVLSSETLSDVPTVMRLAYTIADNIVPSESLTDPVRLAQLALAMNDVPFEDFVFVQYPTLEDPDDDNRVIPNAQAAEPLWEALAAGRPIDVTGRASNHGGVDEQTPAPTEPVPSPSGAPSEGPSGTPSGTPSPTDRAQLPPEISGIDLNQETCSGRRR